MNEKEEGYPRSILCLKAIEQYVGGRNELAKKLSCSAQNIARWVYERQIPKGQILPLVEISEKKFTAEELLGKFDYANSGTRKM